MDQGAIQWYDHEGLEMARVEPDARQHPEHTPRWLYQVQAPNEPYGSFLWNTKLSEQEAVDRVKELLKEFWGSLPVHRKKLKRDGPPP